MTAEPTEPTETRSMVIKDGRLWEQIYDPISQINQFISWDEKNNQPVTVPYQIQNGVKILPIHDDLLLKGAVILPSGVEEYRDIPTLDKDIHDFTYRYVDVSEEHRQNTTWYARLTWTTDFLNTIPYLRPLGDYGSGKTRYEDVVGGICYKPMYVGGSVHSAPIFRVIDKWRGTAIFDEFTLHRSDETEEITQILNNGYQRKKPVLRCNPENKNYDVVCFDPFGPKILATKKQFDDPALESRCITEILTETYRTDIPIDLGPKFQQERAILQNKLLLYRLKNWNLIIPDDTKQIDFGFIQPRIKQTYLPFTVLFQHDPEILKTFIETVKSKNTSLVEENASSMDGTIVNIYCDLKLYNPEAIITPQDIRNELVNKHGYSEEKTRASTVGKHLAPLGFKSELRWVEKTAKRDIHIDPLVLKKLVYRYVLPEKQEAIFKSHLFDKKLEVD